MAVRKFYVMVVHVQTVETKALLVTAKIVAILVQLSTNGTWRVPSVPKCSDEHSQLCRVA